jgi:hypothetical protein
MPGIYCIGGGGFTHSGSAALTGTGVLLSMANTSGDINIAGSGSVTLSPFTSSGSVYDGLLVEHPQTYSGSDNIGGGATSAISGTFYGGGSGNVVLNGGPSYTGIQVIAGSLTLNGGAVVTIG